MPELPDVERFKMVLENHARHKMILGVTVLDSGVIRGVRPQEFARRLKGRRIGTPERRGKWLFVATSGPTLVLHFGMTGGLSWQPPLADQERFARVIFSIDDGNLVYEDQRKLRGLWLAEGGDEIAGITGPLGPDALHLSKDQLRGRLDGRRGNLKSLLMNQQVVAGIGNMLSDEVLWRTRIHPEHKLADLEPAQFHSLARSLQSVLRASVKTGGIPRTSAWLSSQRSAPAPRCPRCQTSLTTSRIGGRTALSCPSCQPP